MRYLQAAEAAEAETFFRKAAEAARKATCHKARCGTVVVSADGEIIGEGYNSPPLHLETNRTCDRQAGYDLARKPLYDKTCCIHAEWRAILDACKRNPEKLAGSRLYFMRLGADGGPKRSGDPYCTVCSRLAMESGIAEFALWQKAGMAVWEAAEYDRSSYAYFAAV